MTAPALRRPLGHAPVDLRCPHCNAPHPMGDIALEGWSEDAEEEYRDLILGAYVCEACEHGFAVVLDGPPECDGECYSAVASQAGAS